LLFFYLRSSAFICGLESKTKTPRFWRFEALASVPGLRDWTLNRRGRGFLQKFQHEAKVKNRSAVRNRKVRVETFNAQDSTFRFEYRTAAARPFRHGAFGVEG
jgi:hypothetical protein